MFDRGGEACPARHYVRAPGALAEPGSPSSARVRPWASMAFADGAARVPGLADLGKKAGTTACDGYMLRELGIGDRRSDALVDA